MMLWPQTLLARSVLLIAMLLILAHLSWLQIFRISTREPRARQVSQQIISTVNLTRAALITAEPSKRFSLLGDIAEREGVQVHVAQSEETVSPLPKTGFYEFIEADLRAQLGGNTKFTLVRNGVEGIWVSFDIDGDTYWMLIPEARLVVDESWRWIGWGALVLLLTRQPPPKPNQLKSIAAIIIGVVFGFPFFTSIAMKSFESSGTFGRSSCDCRAAG